MQVDKILILAKREYLSRVKTKGFWIGTVLLPLFMVLAMVLPSLSLARSKSTLRLALVDTTGTVGDALAAELQSETEAPAKAPASGAAPAAAPAAKRLQTFVLTRVAPAPDAAAQRGELDRRVLDKELDAWLWIDQPGLAKNKVEYHGESVANFLTQERLEDAVSNAVRTARLSAAGYDPRKVSELSRGVGLETVRVTSAGGRAEAGLAGAAIAYFLFFILYLMLALYGAQVMNGVLEEKSSRIVELIISTVRPFELLMGKLLGIGAVGFTQVAIWAVTAFVMTAPGMLMALSWDPSKMPQVSPLVLMHFLLFFVIGFFLYATYYAALGSAFNDIREAQQAAASAMFLLVPPMLIFPMVINDPDSRLAVVTSLIPFFTPLLMVLRIAVKMPPLWQVLLGYALTIATTVVMIWVCGKIYRVGILMYGKKPTVQELWRWLRYT